MPSFVLVDFLIVDLQLRLQSDGWFYIYIIAQPSENYNSVLVTVIIFRQIARSFSCFFCSVAAHCTEEDIVHLVDLLLSDSIIHIVGISHLDLDTLIRHIVNCLLSLFYGRCCIQIFSPFRQLFLSRCLSFRVLLSASSHLSAHAVSCKYRSTSYRHIACRRQAEYP